MVSSFMRGHTIVFAAMVMVGGALVVGGCDDKPRHSEAPPATTNAERKADVEKPAAPTTQELLHGARHRVQLSPLPASLMAPPGWGVRQMPGSGVVFLQGPLPTGEEVHIQLSRKETRWTEDAAKGVGMEERIGLLKAGALKEQKDHPERVKHVSVRELGAARVFEKQSVSPPSTMLHLDEKGNPITLPPLYHWTITLFVPAGDSFNAYELNFLDLNTVEHEDSRDFLKGILNTLELDGTPATRP